MTVGVEAAIPVLLAFARTRNVGIMVAALFHYIVALNPISGFYNFSAMLFALFALFAPRSLVAHPMVGSRAFRAGAASLAGAFAIAAVLASNRPGLLYGRDPGFSPLPLLTRKLMLFRPVERTERRACQH